MMTKKSSPLFFVITAISLSLILSVIGSSSVPFAQAAHTTGTTFFVWNTSRCSTGATACNDLKAATEDANSGPAQILLFHFGPGQTPGTLQRDTIKAVTGFSAIQKGYQGTSLAQLETLAPLVVEDFGAGAILGYNLEGFSPDEEEANPIAAYQDAKAIATQYGIRLLATPSRAISLTSDADDIAGLVSYYNLQVQALQDSDTTCNTLVNEAVSRAAFIHQTYAHKIITYQTSLTQPAASGKTVLDTIEDCMDAATPTTDLSGATVWWGGVDLDEPSRTNSRYEQAYAYHESHYSP